MGVNYSDIIERMRWAGKLKNDSAVARTLGVTPQALSNYKKRGVMPTDLVLKFSNIYGLSVDWLLTGEGEMRKHPSGEMERRDYLAAEETAVYGREKEGFPRRGPDFASLSPDELIYVGKLLKILRSPNNGNAASIKCTIDAFLKAAEAAETRAQSEKEPAKEIKN